MAHQYYGSEELILTSSAIQNFNSGLSRLDCTYRCRTTKANNLELTLAAGFRIVENPKFVISENAKRVDESDGFTTFTVSAFYGTLQTTTDGSASIPSVLGIARTNISIRTITNRATTTQIVQYVADYPIEVLSDTFTQTFTVFSPVSCLDLKAPQQDLNLKIQSSIAAIEANLMQGFSYTEPSINTNYTFRSLYVPGTLLKKLKGEKTLINVNRSNFGLYDEITVTWGLKIQNITISTDYTLSQSIVFSSP